ncbi:hypothetical protein CKY10_05125 [Photorhabdus sp. HUG-39]|uniref:Tail fiber protein n=2 Tax=Photorhabdus TaxID=29487 RepID=A0ABX0B2R6_9GAMM|nr:MULTISPECIES: tail fiber protein [Photorhabdus]MDB6367725.1 tail fiber protein [Photorhabdus bodei]NDL11175.1 tail fiber protein [Photorhabdus kayaii]NDL24806.1 tail fiber protein [Photorhabdus kayaii]RAX11127.1 hypothetical protein CKY10_05125 [Photorhabdus sp. HUG-39]
MEKKNDFPNSESNQENTNNKVEDLSADDLKKRFKAGSIPLQTDYEHLIDIADIGRKAVGKVPKQTGPGTGLKLDDNGTLNLKMGPISSKDFSPLILEKDILSVDLGSGLINKENGISVGQGNGIVVNTDDVAVKAANGITVDGKGISVKSNNGINVDADGVSVKTKNTTIKVESIGISVGIGWGVRIGDEGLDVQASNGINVDKNGVSVKAGNGIKVDDKGVSIDPNKILPRGMIVMFSGSNAPEGWALCDGNNGTPNLIDRFILGGDFSGVKGQSNTKVSGPKDGKSFSFNSDEATLNINGKTNEKSLSIGQIPNHDHLSGIIIDTNIMAQYGAYEISSDKRAVASSNNTRNRYLYYSTGMTTSKGVVNGNSPETHNHDIDVKNTGRHSHSNKITVPYYILAFIMKL